MKRWTKRGTFVAAGAALSMGLALVPLSAQAANPEPGSSPAPYAKVRVGNGSSPSECASGLLCAFVESNSDPDSGWWDMKYLHCGVVNLSYWHDQLGGGDSWIMDDQTGGVTTTLYSGYGGGGSVLGRYKAKPGVRQTLTNAGGWNPVNSIRVC